MLWRGGGGATAMRDMWMACADGAVGTQGRARGACEDLAGGAAGDSREIEERLHRRGAGGGGFRGGGGTGRAGDGWFRGGGGGAAGGIRRRGGSLHCPLNS
jgi:hypothetical protein